METNNYISDKFSWRRCLNFGLLYKKSIIYYLIASALIPLCCVIYLESINHRGYGTIALFGLSAMLINALIDCSPIVFSRLNESINVQLPVKASEKFIFYMVFSMIIVPTIVSGMWHGMNYLLTLINENWDLTTILNDVITTTIGVNTADLSEEMASHKVLEFTMNIIMTFGGIITTLYTVIRASSHRTLKMILSLIGFYIAIAVISSFTHISSISPSEASGNISEMLPMLLTVRTAVLIYDIVMSVCLYKLLASRQVKS